MSANDILDVLSVQRDQNDQQPVKKKQKTDGSVLTQKQSGISRELYNLLGPNTPPINLSGVGGSSSGLNNNQRIKPNSRPSPWTKMAFTPLGQKVAFHHWKKGSRELLEQEDEQQKTYFFDKFNTKLSLPELVNQEVYESYLEEFAEAEKLERERIAAEKLRIKQRAAEKQREKEEREKESLEREKEKSQPPKAINNQNPIRNNNSVKPTPGPQTAVLTHETLTKPDEKPQGSETIKSSESEKETESKVDVSDKDLSKDNSTDNEKSKDAIETDEKEEPKVDEENEKASKKEPITKEGTESTSETIHEAQISKTEVIDEEPLPEPWSYEETSYLFELCNAFELKWPIIADRYTYPIERSQEDIKEHFYRVSLKILKLESNSNPNLLESLESFSKTKENERKQYLENLLKRTPAEIAEEESLVIEARRFELAAKKMLVERSYLLNLLDSPQTSQSVQQYQSSQGLTTLYNNLMIMDKHQKKRQQLQLQKNLAANGRSNGAAGISTDPVPPAIPIAASSSFKKDRSFQTHLQQYLSGILKQQGGINKNEPSAIQQLLSKRLTVKEEEAYGLHYHENEKIAPGVTLRSTQKLPGLQQRQSVLKSVNTVLQEMDIPTAGGTNWKPVMPTRKTMAKYDTLLRAVVALLEVKKGKDKLEAEIRLTRSQRNL